ncbi:MAG: hypothetical protein GX495_15565 [Chloroflexi bacterium]|jgi:hypothetical protein|nr:hypothetical protein [Chloroflexota bacterium]
MNERVERVFREQMKRHTPITQAVPNAGSYTIPLGAAGRGRLVFSSIVDGLVLRAAAGMRGLLQGRLSGQMTWVGFEEGVVVVGGQTAAGSSAGSILLNASLPWEIEFRNGVRGISAQLEGLELHALDVLGGVYQASLHLPRPAGTAYIHLSGGVFQMSLRRPRGVAISLTLQGGADRLTVDGKWCDSLSNEIYLESHGFARAAARYAISISGGASEVSIA